MKQDINNPFEVFTPDYLVSTETIVHLFVNVFEDFTSVPQPGHVFLNGPRGSGKSMMFRYMMPDCQMYDRKDELSKIPYYSVYVPIKLTNLNNPELDRMVDKGNHIFNEHVLTIYFSVHVFEALMNTTAKFELTQEQISEVNIFYNNFFTSLLKRSGWSEDLPVIDENSNDVVSSFEKMRDVCTDIFLRTQYYLKLNALIEHNHKPYSGPLYDYLNFLFPILKKVKEFSFMPKGAIFLLVDDADNLNRAQTMVLNTWVSYRTSSVVSLKISTQLGYKTFNTINGLTISSPHDFYEVNILTVYSSSTDIYNRRVTEIVKKRLENFGISGVTPEDFFPVDEKQELEIKKIKEQIIKEYPEKGKGYRASDDVQRYAIPEYIKKLKGMSKSGYTYSYAGFNQLVSISSGIVRYFLAPATRMFYHQMRHNLLRNANAKSIEVNCISPSIQNEVIREYSNEQLFDEYEKLFTNVINENQITDYAVKLKKLKNLIIALGGIFHTYLISERAERKVFSFAFSDEPDDDIFELLELGVRYGYFHKSSIGNKDGTGRKRLYILSRLLAPSFLLDPTSFAGYKFFTNSKIREAINNPDSFIRKYGEGTEDDLETIQLEIFNNE